MYIIGILISIVVAWQTNVEMKEPQNYMLDLYRRTDFIYKQ